MGIIKTIQGTDFKNPVKNEFGVDIKVRQLVTEIIKDIAQRGDKALYEYTARFDGHKLDSLRVSQAALEDAEKKLPAEIKKIFQSSIDNVKSFHEKQKQESWQENFEDGTVLGQMLRPLDRVGVYIPGGKAVYPSTLIMNIVPAQIAGVKSIAVVSPPGENGLPHDLVLSTASMLGVEEIYAIGGAQSIAALAYGTETIAPVCKITGPGNQYVAEAKRQVFGKVGIDSIAGPSEILILHDDPDVPVEYIVRDMLSQAEHDSEAQSILITTIKETAEKVAARLEEIIPTLPRNEIIAKSIGEKGLIILAENIEVAIEISNKVAPEHLEFLVKDEQKLSQVRNAGAVFVGKWSSEPVGDYFAGPNHTIPTNGAARYSSPLGVQDFVKHSSLIKYSQARLEKEGEMIAQFADLEQLNAHAAAIRARLN